jgi:hypothetical protein
LPNPEFGKVNLNRRPVFLSLGEFRPKDDQPLWFSRSKLFMDNQNDNDMNGFHGDLSLYASFTTCNNSDILWYPDRKIFLLGKKIRKEFLSDLEVPNGRY